jgi:DNA-binding transcriptional LysR family regulator
METRHLRYFLAVVEAGTLTRAAEQLGIAQPALSQALDRMEHQLGAKLFVRSRSGARLTPAGEAIVEEVRMGLSHIDTAAHQAREIARGMGGRLTIGFVAAGAYRILPAALQSFRADMPDVQVSLLELSNTEQVAALEDGTLDMAILFTPVEVQGRMNQRVLRRDRLIAVLPSDFELGPDGKVGLKELAPRGLVFAPREQVPVMRAEILSALRQAGEEGRVVQEAYRIMAVLACVAGHCGVSLLPEATRDLGFPGVRFCEVRESRLLPMIELSVIWPARSRRSLADVFADVLAAQAAAD